MKILKTRFRKGAASFYIVAFSTLILMIIATSFAAVIISEVERTSNDDLAQSAYDSALAGVEDAKLAYYNYQNCLDDRSAANCEAIIAAMEGESNCDMLQDMLGRDSMQVIEVDTNNVGGVDNNMQQYYTCVIINDTPPDYSGQLNSANMIKVVKAEFDGVPADSIDHIKISWYSDKTKQLRYNNADGFWSLTSKLAAAPPTISVTLIQTGSEFSLEDFTMTQGNQTNRGTLYLVPKQGSESNKIGAEEFLKSNDKTANKTPYEVGCNNDGVFACSAEIKLPKPIGGTRNDDTFMFVVGLPYGTPDTDFVMEFFCEDGNLCYTREEGVSEEIVTNQVSLKGVQVEVDSTGRANDLYRRVITRLEDTDDWSLSIMGPLELLGGSSDGGSGLDKTEAVPCEANFTSSPNCR